MSGSEDESSLWEGGDGEQGEGESPAPRLLWHESDLVFAGEVRKIESPGRTCVLRLSLLPLWVVLMLLLADWLLPPPLAPPLSTAK